ncbi:hypothetical protein AKJ37_00575 [candidate division MSBL1 archaeon SCGC-AAA259I09]|uniref:Uncharacterized protein n=1 Tax=candidate division MSBL1 archaeon SCGC-AAA259I09 TaxID=1698267 RepID=A0A133UVX4_9EURY|nr:hypothetical protein AKJ37_00575 [candidate division MSBL1 archaeon SCGC-AAA259I09]
MMIFLGAELASALGWRRFDASTDWYRRRPEISCVFRWRIPSYHQLSILGGYGGWIGENSFLTMPNPAVGVKLTVNLRKIKTDTYCPDKSQMVSLETCKNCGFYTKFPVKENFILCEHSGSSNARRKIYRRVWCSRESIRKNIDACENCEYFKRIHDNHIVCAG